MYTGTCDTSIEIGIVQHIYLCGMRKYKLHAYPARTQYMIFSTATKIKRSTSSHLDSSSASHVMVFTSGFLLLHTRQHMLEPHETLRSLITQYVLPYTPLNALVRHFCLVNAFSPHDILLRTVVYTTTRCFEPTHVRASATLQ